MLRNYRTTLFFAALCCLTVETASADSVNWTGTNITISGSTVQVNVELQCTLDSAESGMVALRLQTDDDVLPTASDDPGLDKVRVRKADRHVKLSKRVRLLPGQLQLQVWTPLFPDGETESSTVRVQRYALKKSSGGAVDLVPLNEEKYKELRDRLFKAARRGDITLVKRLLEGEGEIISKNHLLLVAAQAGESIESADHKELLGLFLEKGANVNYQNPPNGFTALICCTAAGHRDCVKMLLSKGADTKLKDKNKRTALAMAVRNGSKEMVELLLANGVDPAEESPETLLYAIDSGKDEIAKLLIAKGGATLKGYTGDYAYTPLTLAAEKGLLPLVRSMLLHDADVNEQDGEEKTALIRAADKGEAGVARFLIANAAKLNLKDEDGNTALMLAAQRADIEIVQLLIDEGAYLQARNSDGENALDLVKVGSKRERARKSMWGGDFATPAYQNDTALLGEFAKVDELLRKALANH